MAQIRQERLQHLREERMRRQQRRMGPDITVAIPFRKGKNAPVSESVQNEHVWAPDGHLIQASPVIAHSMPADVSTIG